MGPILMFRPFCPNQVALDHFVSHKFRPAFSCHIHTRAHAHIRWHTFSRSTTSRPRFDLPRPLAIQAPGLGTESSVVEWRAFPASSD